MQVSGLASGLDTAGIVKQLMSVERLSGQGLIKGKTKAEGLLGAFQKLNSLMKTLQEAAAALVPDTIFKTSAWSATTATSSKPELATVTTGTNASAGSLSFTVNQVASAGSVISATPLSGDAVVNSAAGGSAFDLTLTTSAGDTTIQVGADAKLADVAKAINDAGAGVKASMVQVVPDQYRLQVQSTTSGAASNVSLNGGPFGDFDVLATGQDTEVMLGDPVTGVKITSPTTTLKDVMPGVTITAVKADPTTQVTVDVTQDVDGVSAKVQAFVDAANGVLSNISANSSYDAGTKKAGMLLGDSTSRQVQNLVSQVFTGDMTTNPGLAGVSIDRDGKVTFDKAKFAAAYAKDPAAVEKAVTASANKMVEVSKQATNPTDGLLAVRIRGEESFVKDYTKQIAKFEDRMTLRQTTLERQFAALESMLSKLQAQGNWLAGQLQTLPTNLNNSKN